MSKNPKYEYDFHVRLTADEAARVRIKMAELGTTNVTAYFRKMALDGYCVNLDLSDVRQMVTLLRRCSNNLNQYAAKANATGSIYSSDIVDLQIRLDRIWDCARAILASLSKIS